MSRPTKLPPGTKVEGNRIALPGAKPRDAAQAKSWAKGGRKGKRRVVKKGLTSLLNSIGKLK